MKLGTFLRELGQPVAYYPKLAKITGSILANLFLCQMYYWQGKQEDPTGWIYKTQAQIEAETGLSRTEQETARRLLRQRGLIKERYSGLPRKLEFWLDEDELENRWAFFLEYREEKPLVKDAKLTQQPSSNPTSSPRYNQRQVSLKEPEPLPGNDSSIMQESCIKVCRNPADNKVEMLQASLPETSIIECSNSASKSVAILQARVQKPYMQVGGNPASNLYTKITTENTSRDYNTLPPYPPQPEKQQPGEYVKHQLVEKSLEVELPEKSSGEGQTQAKTACWEKTNLVGDNSTPARQEDQNRYRRNQSEYPKNLDGSDRLPWDTHKRGTFDPEFEKHMARSLMQYPVYQNLMFGELLTKTRKHISAGRYDLKRRDELLIEWEAMKDGCTANNYSSGSTSSLTAKAAARHAKIARALNMEVS